MKKISLFFTTILLLATLAVCLTSCGDEYVVVGQDVEYDENGEPLPIAEEDRISYDCLFYNNSGDCYIGFTGNEFKLEPNREKVWSYNTSGDFVASYDTSSVVTFTIDGEVMPACGSTAILLDSRLTMNPVSDISGGLYGTAAGSSYSVEMDSHPLSTYFGLTTWWYDQHEKGQGGQKLILIQSQDGHDIGIIEGDDVTWEVEGKLPKTTRIMVDGMPVYIHRCNFMIIPRSLIEKSKTFLDENPHMTKMPQE